MTMDGLSLSDTTKPQNVCFNTTQLEPRHSSKWIASYVDGHAALTADQPSFLPITSYLMSWLQASALLKTYQAGANIATWTGNLKTISATSSTVATPVLQTSGINGQPALYFSGGGGCPTLNFPYLPLGEFTLCAVFQDDASDSSCRIFSNNDNEGMGFNEGPAGTFQFGINKNGTAVLTPPVTGIVGKPHIVVLRRNPAKTPPTHWCYVDGTETSATGGMSTPFVNNGIWIGTYCGNNNYMQFKGYFAEILLYSKSLTDADRDTVVQYLKDQYSL
ncbi:MAG: LamG-like jellyroll fold domain-containing protein [bacterium]